MQHHPDELWITLVDDESDAVTRRIDASTGVGHIAQQGQPGIWLGRAPGEQPRDWHPKLRRPDPTSLTAICFYTKGTAYEQEAKELVESCDAVGLRCVTEGLAPKGSWERNCALKAGFVRDMRSRLRGPLLWIDADARVGRFPTELLTLQADYAMHLFEGWRGFSATVYFDDTPEAARLIERWYQRSEAEPDIWDQIHLDLAWEDIAREHDLTTAWLDERFAKIEDRPVDIDPFIVHTQASRRHKHAVSGGIRGGEQTPDMSVRLARSRSRCRPGPPRSARECTIIEDAADDGVTRWQQHRRGTMTSAYQWCLDRGCSKVALVGAGKHTHEVALPAAVDSSIHIACILDDRADSIDHVGGIPVLALAECPPDIETLIISSDAHEGSLAQRCREVFGDRMPIYEPYRTCSSETEALHGTGS